MKEKQAQIQVVHPLDPIVYPDSKVLILGSFPSVISRKEMFYYANKSNRFWNVLSEVFQEEIEDKVSFCYQHHIAIWDVIHSCTIFGSSDTSIKDVVVNPIQDLCDQSEIHTIFITGQKAYNLYVKYVDCNIQPIALPSTSSANAKMRLEDLVSSYQIIRETLNEEN